MKECRDLFNPPFFWGVMMMNKKSDGVQYHQIILI